MHRNVSDRNTLKSRRKFLVEIRNGSNGLVKCGMAKLRRRLFLLEWINALGVERADIAKAGGVTVSYINNMIGGRRENPAASVLMGISDYLKITVNDLYERPPPKSQLSDLTRLSPAAQDALLRASKLDS